MAKTTQKAKIKFFLNIVLPSILAVVLFIVTLFFVVLPYFEKSIMDRKREMIKELTNTATSILAKYQKDEVDGLLTREEAQGIAISRIQYLRYGEENKDYFWITDMQPVMIVHPYRPDLNGTDLSDFEDSHGKKLFVEFVKTVETSKHGYVEYTWQWKDDPNIIVPKLSYVQLFEPWGWIVGTGIYIEDVKAEISVLTRKFTQISILISFIIALILFYVGRQSFNIERKRNIAEIELNQSREKYRSLVEASTDGLIMWMDGKITFINAVFERMIGRKFNEIADLEIESILTLSEEVRKNLYNEDFSLLKNTIESNITINNKITDVVVNLNVIKFYERNAVVFSVKDVSSDNQAKEELLFNKEKFKVLMDRLNQGIFRTSMDNKGKFIEANSTALQILGYKVFDEISGMYILDFFVDKEDKLNFKSNLLKNGFIKNRIIKLRNKQGKFIYASVSLVVVNDLKGPRFCDGIIQDITAQMNKESDNVNSEFTKYMQLLSQPAINIAVKAGACFYNSPILDVIESMIKSDVSTTIVYGPDNEELGYISDKHIRKGLLNENEISNLKAFQVMESPLLVYYETNPVLNLLPLFSDNENTILFLKGEGEKITGYITRKELFLFNEFLPVKIINSVQNTNDITDLKQIYKDYISAIIPLIEVNTNSSVIFNHLSIISDLICRRIIEIGITKFGKEPIPFAFITMGSEGRREQTLYTDQDNAIIYEDTESLEIKQYFKDLAEFISDSLNSIGYNYCKGGIMAKNPEYCQSLSVWKKYFSKWINNGNAKDLLEISIFFDFRLTYGEEKFVNELREYIDIQTKQNPAYLFLLTQNNLKLKPQVNFWGNILLETAGAPPETVNIKETIMPIVNFARIYALKYGINEVNTTERLKKLYQSEILTESTYKNISQAFDILGIIRLNHQATLIKNNISPDNLINTRNFSELDQAMIKKILSNINTMLSRLSFDFKGTL
ncbi:MAG TPA: cache domain-containing protein [Bacteroidales bacterium]|nr:cache domain-containing protein [Bacteroidales bacterium]